MSDSELNDLVAPLILTYVTSNPGVAYGTSLRVNTSGLYDVNVGVTIDTRSDVVGAHPASNSTISTYTLYQSARPMSLSLSARPVAYVQVGDEWQIKSMSDQEIIDQVVPSIVQTMITGGQGAYYLGPTSSGAPVGGTWTSYGNMTDTYYVNSTLTTEQYTLWQRTTGTTAGNIRPLKVDTSGNLVEMTNTEITQLYQAIGEYIRTTGIGQYVIQPTAPSTGTWMQRGYFTNTVNNLQDAAYNGTYIGSFTSPYTRAFTGLYNGAFTGNYAGTYSRIFTGAYAGGYANTFTGAYNRAFTGAFSGFYVGGYAGTYSKLFTGAYTGLYAGAYAGFFTGAYVNVVLKSYQSPYTGAWYTGGYSSYYSGSYQGQASGTFTGTYIGAVAKQFVSPFSGTQYTGFYGSAFTGTYQAGAGIYTGLYSGSYSGSYQGNFTGVYLTAFTGAYAQSFTGSFTGAYTGIFSGAYSGGYTGAFTGTYAGSYTSAFSGAFSGAFTGLYNTSFTGAYTGLTVLNTTSTTVYKLWVRTA
jgi:hypothetical protein